MKIIRVVLAFIFTAIAIIPLHAENANLKGYFPEIEPYQTGYLATDSEYSLYWEESGNPQGSPILFLHGGPGVGTNPDQRRFFDPKHYRIILFDQRGSGKSKPLGGLKNNTTSDLIDDIDRLLNALKIDKCILFGGSWGSTLALCYAIKHPDRVTGLILRGIFLGRQRELDWFYKRGANFFSPQAWNAFLKPIPNEERGDLIAAYYKLLNEDDVYVRARAAASWAMWEYANFQMKPDDRIMIVLNSSILFYFYVSLYGREVEPQARIECHYFLHKCFLESDNWIIENIDKIRFIPTTIVQGRYDLICPFESAWELHEAWPESKFEPVVAGHSATEPATLDALIRATEDFKKLADPKIQDSYISL